MAKTSLRPSFPPTSLGSSTYTLAPSITPSITITPAPRPPHDPERPSSSSSSESESDLPFGHPGHASSKPRPDPGASKPKPKSAPHPKRPSAAARRNAPPHNRNLSETKSVAEANLLQVPMNTLEPRPCTPASSFVYEPKEGAWEKVKKACADWGISECFGIRSGRRRGNGVKEWEGEWGRRENEEAEGE